LMRCAKGPAPTSLESRRYASLHCA
jgi:hypothetical protein